MSWENSVIMRNGWPVFNSRQIGIFGFYHFIQVASGTYSAPASWVPCTHVFYFKNNFIKCVFQLFVNIQPLTVHGVYDTEIHTSTILEW
jgi:hypothetical protein